jgi:broad specificity phosphatase PhoE
MRTPSHASTIEGGEHLAHLQAHGLLGLQRSPSVVLLPHDPARAPSTDVWRLHLVRHGQGFHNLLGDEYRARGVQFSSRGDDTSSNNPYVRKEVWDPPLTTLGREQAKALRPLVRSLTPELVLASPMSRAALTAILAFEDKLGTVPFIAHEGLREMMGVHTCDARNPLADVRRDFPQLCLSELEKQGVPEIDDFNPTEREDSKAVCARAHDLLLWLRARSEREVALVTHSAFLFTMLNAVVESDAAAAGEGIRAWFETGELRTIDIAFRD